MSSEVVSRARRRVTPRKRFLVNIRDDMEEYKALLRLSTTKLANWPITDDPADIVVSLSGSFQLDFLYTTPRRRPTLLYPIQKMNRIRRQLTV